MKEGPELRSFFMVRRSYGDDLEGIREPEPSYLRALQRIGAAV